MFLASLCTTITLQPIQLESCSNILNIQLSLSIFNKKWKVLYFAFFVGDIISGDKNKMKSIGN